MGYGFGVSGAAALATALAVNADSGPGLTLEQAAVVAHCADVVNRTGMEDVAGLSILYPFQGILHLGPGLSVQELQMPLKRLKQWAGWPVWRCWGIPFLRLGTVVL